MNNHMVGVAIVVTAIISTLILTVSIPLCCYFFDNIQIGLMQRDAVIYVGIIVMFCVPIFFSEEKS